MRRNLERWRLYIFTGAFMALFLLIGYRVFTISYVKHAWYSAASRAHADGSRNVLARGSIFLTDRDGLLFAAAANKKFAVLTVNASKIPAEGQSRVLQAIGELIGSDEAAEAEQAVLRDDDIARQVGRYLTDDEVALVQEMNIPGLTVSYITDRFYPGGFLGADAIGFFGYDPDGRHGQYGIESSYERELSGSGQSGGVPGMRSLGHLAALVGIGGGDASSETPLPSDVVLTIDRNVQAHVQDVLEAVLTRFSATHGSVIVQESATGRIVAMADSPSFDPNRYGSVAPAVFINGPVQRTFEPGSSFKPFTMAMGLETGTISPTSTFTDKGPVLIAGYTIRNFTDTPFGTVTMSRVLEKSINTGVMHVEGLVGDKRFLDGVINLGFGQRTGVDLPGESNGDVANLYSGRKINFLTASFGQGITVTPIQLVTAYSAIANGGKLMRPYVVDRVVRDGTVVRETVPEVAGIPFSTKTAGQLRTMLTSVVDNGFDKARIPRYDVAGKTGTAQIASPGGGYVDDEYIHSFAGFIPATDPQYTILIVMERPRGITFAADSLSPSFKDIASFLINYYRIPPTRP